MLAMVAFRTEHQRCLLAQAAVGPDPARVTYAWVALASGNPCARITTVGPDVILSVKESHQRNSPGRKSWSGNDPRALGAYQVRGRAARAWKHSKLAACPPPLS